MKVLRHCVARYFNHVIKYIYKFIASRLCPLDINKFTYRLLIVSLEIYFLNICLRISLF